MLPDYNTTRETLRLSDSYAASNLCFLAVPRTTLNLQANQSISKNKWTSKQHTDLAQRIDLIHTKLEF